MSPERLTGLDASFLYMETPTMHLHVAMAAVFDPSTVPGGYSFQRVRTMINGRIPDAPVFQRRLVEVPMRLGHPVWVDDPDFDIDNHLRRAALPSPGGMRELGDFAADVISRQLHRDRPLWEMWIVEGLEDGKIALVTKMHHSTIDGVSGAELLGILFDLEPEPPAPPHETERPLDTRIPSGLELVSQAMISSLVAPFDVGRMMLRTVRSIFGIRQVRRDDSIRSGALPLTAPRTSINVAVHARRRVAFAAASLEDAKALKNKMGTTVNDVVLAMCAGALRTYLLAGDELPEIPLVSVVPVSVTPDVAELKGSNKVSSMFVQLPCQLDDPLERLQVIHEGTKGAKEEHKALGATTLQLGRARLAEPRRGGGPSVHRNEAGRPAPPRGQPGGLQRARPRLPAVPGRQRAAGHVPVGPRHGRHGPERDHHELPRRPVLGLRSRLVGRAASVGHRGGRAARAHRADGGGRAGVPALRRPHPSRARDAAHGELGPHRSVTAGRGGRYR